jgi:phage tail-like protein
MPAEISAPAPSSLQQYLPGIYRRNPFLGQFLLAFEKVLLGRNDGVALPNLADEARFPQRGLEETIDRLWTYFDPTLKHAPQEFLPWLAGWAALSLRADLSDAQQRNFVANAIRLYRLRGTVGNMEELLLIFTGQTATVRDDLKEPHRFEVGISFAQRDKDLIARQQAIAHALIVLEKPAHTLYDLILYFPSMEIGNCRIGETTLLSTSRPS